MADVSIVTDQDFDEQVIGNDKPVIVSFAATWSPPSRNIAQLLRNIADSRDDIDIAKIDVGGQDMTLAANDNPITRERFNIQIFPTLLMFKNGKVAGMLIGEVNEQNLDEWINRIKNSPTDKTIATEDFPAFADGYYQKLQQAAQEQAEANFSKTLKLYRGLSLTSSFARVAGAFMLASTVPGLAGMFMAAAIMAPAGLNAFNILKSKNAIPVEPKFSNGLVRTVFNMASLAGGAFLAHAASLGTLSSAATVAGYTLGGYIIVDSLRKIWSDVKKAFSTDLSGYPVTPPERHEQTQEEQKPPAP